LEYVLALLSSLVALLRKVIFNKNVHKIQKSGTLKHRSYIVFSAWTQSLAAWSCPPRYQ